MKNILLPLWYLVLHLWQLPQHLAAWCLILFCDVERRQDDYKGRKVYYHPLLKGRNGEGVCLGGYIFHDNKNADEAYIAHEYGHSLQSLYTGWLYFLFIGLPSICNPYSGARYFSIFCAWWANQLGCVEVKITGKRINDYKLVMRVNIESA